MLGDDAEGMVHRGLLGVLERPVELVRVADQEAAGEGAGETLVVRIEEFLALRDAAVLRFLGVAVGVGLAEDHVVASHAGDAVPREAAEMRFRRVGGVRDGVDHCRAGSRGRPGRVWPCRWRTDAGPRCRGSRGRWSALSGKSPGGRTGLAVELGEEDRIATGEAHRAGAPGAIGGEIIPAGLSVATIGAVIGNCRPVPPALWQPTHWSEVTKAWASFGPRPATQTLS